MQKVIIPKKGKENDFKTVATTQPRKKRGRNKRNTMKISYCSECGFKSDRAYNVFRHYERFHRPMKRRITCCEYQFICKADYYRHCAKFHPNKRKYTLMTRIKYKITGSDNEENFDDDDNENEKNVKKEENEDKPSRDLNFDFDFDFNDDYDDDDDNDDDDDDDTFPNFLKKSNKSKKKGIKETKSKSVKILFQGNITSFEQAKIQSEYLADIDFESFKLPLTFKTKDRSLRLA